jgi:carotenoid 1,2-hydratase
VHGITLIAFIGSVFSPWYRFARRGGRLARPENHVCMNVALYGGNGKRWAMTERGAGALRRDATHLQIGPSSLHWDGTVLTAEIAETTCPIPGRLRGRIRVHPQALPTHEVFLDGAGLHRWSPIAPGARVEVEMVNPALRWQGTAYLDTNSGDTPLEEAFGGWNWSRAKVVGGTAVLYHGLRRTGDRFCVALRYDRHGNAENFDPPPEVTLPRTFWRMPRITRSEAGAQVVQGLEDAPFYSRSVLRSRLMGEEVTAVHESLSLDRFVTPAVQFMLPFKAPRALK